MARPPPIPSSPLPGDPKSDLATEPDIPSLLSHLKGVFLKNAHLRKIHSTSPALFLRSELDLHTALHALFPIALTPALYTPLVDHNGLTLLAQLLHHPNDDILYTVISLLHDLAVDVDEQKARIQMHGAMLEQRLLQELTNTFSRLVKSTTDSEEQDSRAEALDKTFALFEDVLDGRPQLFAKIVEKTTIMVKCLAMVQLQPPVIGAVELLAVLVQEDVKVKDMFLDNGGMPIVLTAVKALAGGVEVIEDLFGILCSILLTERGRDTFAEDDGVPIVLEIMRKSKRYRGLALRSLDFACVAGGKVVRKVFESGGLGILFAVLGTFEKGTWKEADIRSMGESLLSILFGMLSYGRETERARLLRKMREGAKVVLIVRMYVWFHGELGDGGLEEQMDRGLLAVQTGAVILGYVIAYGGETVRKAVLTIFKEMGIGLEDIIRRMRKYVQGIEDEEIQGRERDRIEKVVEDIMSSVGDAEDVK